MQSKMTFEQFVPLALRTESKLDGGVRMDEQTLIALLELGIAAGEVLDVVKKSVFYNKPVKFDGNIIASIEQVMKASDQAAYTLDNAYSDKPSEALTSGTDTPRLVNARILHAVLGKYTESAELLQAVLKSIRNRTEMDMVNIMEELGDDQWYDAVLVDETGIDLNVARARVINKLAVRYPESFDDIKASERDLDAERKALEGQ